ncbi:hypothetical protein E1263_14550 [Kribbella antibiotica]|uniref:tRNA nuclease CdiA C-terminal domain-containing protein n=1 Tax=Kribbella antibiotica TaxID=190195 RepID=A0A4R4ZN61_9ACTN|nr:hypothetical protein [Kribbella antibiotica]TDD59566.1 hypothetical protein E1263_14550 [Kribbella antibiotica]
MPSELQRVARGLVECLDEVPQVLHHLQRTAVRCRENAATAAQGGATVAAHQLDAAARACDAAAHYLSMAPPKARAWADRLVGGGSGTKRPSSDSADRNRTTGGTGDVPERDARGRTKRLTATFEDVEVAEDNEPPLITVARKAFEKFRKDHEKDDEQNPNPEEPLEVEIIVTETGEFEIEEKTEKEEKEEEKRNERLLADHEFLIDLEEPIKNLLEAMAESAEETWDHATFVITASTIEATFDYPEDEKPQPIVVDINLPPLQAVVPEFDPAFDLRPLEFDFAPGVHDPQGKFEPKERYLAERLVEEGWRVDARPQDYAVKGRANPDATLRRHRADDGHVVEFKTLREESTTAVKRSIHTALKQLKEIDSGGEVFIDGRAVELREAIAEQGFRRACGQPGTSVWGPIHVILGDGRIVTWTKEQ